MTNILPSATISELYFSNNGFDGDYQGIEGIDKGTLESRWTGVNCLVMMRSAQLGRYLLSIKKTNIKSNLLLSDLIVNSTLEGIGYKKIF